MGFTIASGYILKGLKLDVENVKLEKNPDKSLTIRSAGFVIMRKIKIAKNKPSKR